jgi:hypothetical protein
MKNSLIYQSDFSDSINLRKRLTHLLVSRSFSEKLSEKLSTLPQPRDGHSAEVFNNQIFIFGGDRNKFPFNDLYSFYLD